MIDEEKVNIINNEDIDNDHEHKEIDSNEMNLDKSNLNEDNNGGISDNLKFKIRKKNKGESKILLRKFQLSDI